MTTPDPPALPDPAFPPLPELAVPTPPPELSPPLPTVTVPDTLIELVYPGPPAAKAMTLVLEVPAPPAPPPPPPDAISPSAVDVHEPPLYPCRGGPATPGCWLRIGSPC